MTGSPCTKSNPNTARVRDLLATEGLGVSAQDVLCLLRHEFNVHIPLYHGLPPREDTIARLNTKADRALESLRQQEVWPVPDSPRDTA